MTGLGRRFHRPIGHPQQHRSTADAARSDWVDVELYNRRPDSAVQLSVGPVPERVGLPGAVEYSLTDLDTFSSGRPHATNPAHRFYRRASQPRPLHQAPSERPVVSRMGSPRRSSRTSDGRERHCVGAATRQQRHQDRIEVVPAGAELAADFGITGLFLSIAPIRTGYETGGNVIARRWRWRFRSSSSAK